jgi:hypothetical protein
MDACIVDIVIFKANIAIQLPCPKKILCTSVRLEATAMLVILTHQLSKMTWMMETKRSAAQGRP